MAFTGPLEDRVAIRELFETYAHGVMTKDPELWGSTWAEDAYWELPEVPDMEGIDGRDAIIEAWTQSMQIYGLENCTKPMIYIATPGEIIVDGDKASMIGYTSEIFDDPETKKTLRVRGRYEDQLVKRDGKWLFKRRSYRMMHQSED